MSVHTFLLTYSVTPILYEYQKNAGVIRNRIAGLDGHHLWIKLKDVETTFKGIIILESLLNEEKKIEAKDEIKRILKTVFDSENSNNHVRISVAVLINEIDSIIEFDIY